MFDRQVENYFFLIIYEKLEVWKAFIRSLPIGGKGTRPRTIDQSQSSPYISKRLIYECSNFAENSRKFTYTRSHHTLPTHTSKWSIKNYFWTNTQKIPKLDMYFIGNLGSFSRCTYDFDASNTILSMCYKYKMVHVLCKRIRSSWRVRKGMRPQTVLYRFSPNSCLYYIHVTGNESGKAGLFVFRIKVANGNRIIMREFRTKAGRFSGRAFRTLIWLTMSFPHVRAGMERFSFIVSFRFPYVNFVYNNVILYG